MISLGVDNNGFREEKFTLSIFQHKEANTGNISKKDRWNFGLGLKYQVSSITKKDSDTIFLNIA